MYINDLPDVVHSMAKLFADDAKIPAIVNSENDANVVQSDLHVIDDWSDKWDLSIIYQKCNHMQKYDATYYMNNNEDFTEIRKVTEQKDLGVLIDDKLKFVPHIQAMVKKAKRNLGIIKKKI